MINRWGVEYEIGSVITFHTARSGKKTGTVYSIDTRSHIAKAYGVQVDVTGWGMIAADDIVSVVK